MYEYKVLTQKDKLLSGKFNPMLLEKAINSYAKQGWRVKGISTAEIGAGIGSREEIIIILERTIKNSSVDASIEDIELPNI